MKKRTLLLLFFLFTLTIVRAAYFENLPYTIVQPDGRKYNCFVSGDEYFNWIHDEDGYTIIQAPNGYFYYAEKDGDILKPSIYLVNTVDPGSVGLTKWAKISKEEYLRRRATMFSFETKSGQPPTRAPHSGDMNNIIIYLRFSDDAEFTTTRQVYDDKFNPTTGVSLKSYFKEVSYNNLVINSTHYPACAMSTNLSYQDTHARNYFQPYNATTNPAGYNGDAQRTSREHQLLVDAVTWINANSPVSTSINIDADNDSKVDNVCFVVKGNSGGWAELLWAHRWSLYSQTVYINGKRVYDYTFQPENQVSVNTLCHEMFHALGSPDLYHYDDGGLNISPMGSWDIMDGGAGHMTAYMKWKYSGNTWITSIPQITTNGTYSLNPLTSATNNCYKIASPYSTDEYFMVEYRNKSGTFETNIPGSGLIVYRIDTRESGNASGPPDEIYVYRPGGSTTVNGTTANAYFSSTVGRTSINDATNPSSFLQNGSIGGLNISNVTTAGTTISFTVTFQPPCTPPTTQASSFSTSAITTSSMTVGWNRGNGTGGVLVIAKSGSAVDAGPLNGVTYTANATFGSGTQLGSGNYVVYNGSGTSVNMSGLVEGTTYYFAIYEYNSTTFCYDTPPLTANAASSGYCPAGSPATSYEYISNVTIGSINQTSARGTNGYENYTSQSTTIQIGTNVTASITVTNPYATDQVLIWIDWNNDNDFLDAGENVYASSGASFTSPHTTTAFSAPAGTSLGTKRMRIRMHDSGSGPNATPCGDASYGEVEDYSVIVTQSCTAPSAPIVGTITQPTCNLATASIVLNGLPATGTWTLTRTPGNITTTGTGTTSTISGISSGTYTFTVTVSGGCISQASSNVVINNQPALPSAPTAGNNGPICPGSSLSLTASVITGATYSWTGPNGFSSTSQNPTVSSNTTPAMGGTYSVTATISGCTSLAGTTVVTVYPKPNITLVATPSAICNGLSTSLTASSDISGTTYLWNPGSSIGTTVTMTPATTTIYTVTGTVSATGCTGSSTVTVTVNPNPVINPNASPASICSGGLSSISASSNITGTTYNWMPGNLNGNTNSVSPASTTTYTVTGTAAGCTGSSTVTINVNPKPVLTPTALPSHICNGASSNLSVNSSVSGTTFTWNPGGFIGSPISVSPGITTTYTVTGTVITTGCTGASSVTLSVSPHPIVTPTAIPATICNGTSALLTVAGATNYNWMPGNLTGSSVSVTPDLTTVYTVTGTSSGCTGSSSVTVNVNPLPSIAGAITGNTSVCLDQNSVIYLCNTIANATSYIWTLPSGATGSSNSENIIVDFGSTAQSGNITVKGHNSCGDGASALLAITVNPKYLFSESQTILSPQTYSWQGNDYSAPGIYYANYISKNGCDSTYTLNLTVNYSPKSLHLKVFLEGLYAQETSMNQAQGINGPQYGNDIADKISVELHNITSPYGIAYEFGNLDLGTNGIIHINNMPGNITGPYYIVIKHRNSIETWSAQPQNFSGDGPFNYDFSVAASQAFGNNMKQIGSTYAVYGGDASQDGKVDASDLALIDNGVTILLSGYNPEDVNGDGTVDATDMALIDNNVTGLIQIKRPQ